MKTRSVGNLLGSGVMFFGLLTTQATSSPSTIDYMNAMTACGIGSKSSVSNETKGTIKRQIDGDVASGRATDEIIPRIADTAISDASRSGNYGLYDRYVACLKGFLKDSSLENQKQTYIPERNRGNYYMEADKLLGQKKYSEAVFPLEQAAKLDLPEAKVALSVLYIAGLPGVPYNPEQSFALLQSAAKQGYVPAYGRLGASYYKGIGTEQNTDEAVKFAKMGIEHNEMSALDLMGDIYFYGSGAFVQDDCKAFDYYSKSMIMGYGPAKISLAVMYISGKCTTKDNKKAHELLESAANQGNPDAIEGLKMMHEKGLD